MPPAARSRQFRHPARLVVAGFAAVIAIGTALLMLPVATTGPGGASFHNAVFQSTAAVTLAGLGIVDVPTYWSPAGQVIILALTQVGALGIVTSSLLLIVLIARRVGLRGRLAAQAETHTTGLGGMRRLVVGIVVFTLCAQALISLVLFALLLGSGRTAGDAAWQGLFHGVAAFNNTGISIVPGGAAAFAGEPGILATMAVAVIVGGLGFPVWLELQRNPRNPSRWSLHAKLTLAATGILLVLGTVVITALEWTNPRTLGAMSGVDRIMNGVFAGVMPRTAGFASLDYGEINSDSLLFTEMLMFAGGGSGSVAGGIKVSTLALLVFVVIAEIRGEAEVNAFRRRIPEAVQRQALTVAALSINTIVLGALVVLASNDLPFADVVFEVAAAFTTAGLSTGITAELNGLGHAVLMVLMFLGRIGPLTLGVALVLRERDRRYSHPDERPLVG
jgi:Trk-type K+ transport system membrane component